MKELIRNLLELQTLEASGSRRDDMAAQAAALRAQIPSQILGHYDRFLARGRKALAAVSHQVCTGCHMRLPLAVIMTLRHEEDLQLCDSCGRYLYLAEEPGMPPAKPVEARPARAARRRKKEGAAEPAIPPIEGNVLPEVTPRPRLNPE